MFKNTVQTSISELSQKLRKLEDEQESFRQEIRGWKATVVKDLFKHAEMIKIICDHLALSSNMILTTEECESDNELDFKPEIEEIVLTPETQVLSKSPDNFVEVRDGWRSNENENQELLCYYCGAKFQSASGLENHVHERHGSPVQQMNSISEMNLESQLDINNSYELSDTQCTISNLVSVENNFENVILEIEHEEVDNNISLEDASKDESIQLSKDPQLQDNTMLLLLRLQDDLSKEKAANRFWCPTNCGKSFKHRWHMIEHVETNCGTIRNFECAVCGRKFVKKNNMKLHILDMHFSKELRGDRPYDCPDCGQQYRHRRDLVRHRKSKCGTVKNFPCDICGKKLSSKYHVRKHIIAIHTPKAPKASDDGDRRYICNNCDRKYLHRRNLVRHLQSSCGTVKRFQCPMCPAKFTQKNGLPRHLRNVHHVISVQIQDNDQIPFGKSVIKTEF